jgi:hypothetical protein
MIINIFDFIADQRPPRAGWATGSYTCQCCQCNEFFLGDKRAWMCSNCAWDGIKLKQKQVIVTKTLKEFSANVEDLTNRGYNTTYDGMMTCNLTRNGENIEVILKTDGEQNQ